MNEGRTSGDAVGLEPADITRLKRAIVLFGVGLTVAAVPVVTAVLTEPTWKGAATLSLFVAALVPFGVSFRFAQRGEVTASVLTLGLTLLGLCVPGTWVQDSGPVVLAGPLLVVCIALPYLPRRPLGVLAIAALATTAVIVPIAVLAERPRPRGPVPVEALHIFWPLVFSAVIYWLLWQFATRMRELRSAEVAASREVTRLTSTLEVLVSSSPLAIAVFSPEGVAQLWNPAAEQLFGITRDAAIGRRVDALLAPEGDVSAPLRRLQAGEAEAGVELRVGAIGQPPRSLELAFAPLTLDGQVVGYAALAADVSGRHRTELELRQAQKMDVLGRLAGGVAHDFNNLLTVILAEVELLAPGAAPADIAVSRDAIKETSERAADLCRQLLAFSRQQVLQARLFDLNALTAELAPVLRRLAGSRITVHFTPAPQPALVSIDKSQFEQVLLNLVANARDAMASGGELFLSIEVSAAHVCLVARDTGEGMEESVRARIFDPFFTTKSVGRGTGLGLATVAQVVSRAGGEVAVESRLKEGTTFRVVLPRVSAESRRPEGPAASPARNGRLTVLVLDDEPRVRDVTAEHLRSFGFHAETVSDPREFRARIAAPEPLEVLVTDVAMPVVGGVELAREALATRPSIGLVFMSGYATDPAVGELVASGRARFLAKPFTKEQLREAVEAAVGSGPSATATERPR